MLRSLKTNLLIAVIPLLLVSVIAVNGYSKEKPYVLGADISVTGFLSFIGGPEAKTIPLVVNKINKEGGINGHPLKVIVYDDMSNTTQARLNVLRLIKDDHVIAIFGPSGVGPALSVVSLAKRYKIPLIAMTPSKIVTVNPKTGKIRKWVFQVVPLSPMVVEKIYGFMKKRGITKVAIITNSTAFGMGGRRALLKYAPKYGIKIVADETYSPKDTDMSVQLMKIKATDAQALVEWAGGVTQVIVTRQWKQLGLSKKMLLFHSHAFGSQREITLTRGAANGTYMPLGKVNIGWLLPASDPQKKPIMAYAKSYEKAYGVWPPSFGGHVVDSLALLTDALRAVGPNKAKIRYYIEHKKDYIGMHGIFNFSPTDHNGLHKDTALDMVEVINGKFAFAH